jgi:hypothetical protein
MSKRQSGSNRSSEHEQQQQPNHFCSNPPVTGSRGDVLRVSFSADMGLSEATGEDCSTVTYYSLRGENKRLTEASQSMSSVVDLDFTVTYFSLEREVWEYLSIIAVIK